MFTAVVGVSDMFTAVVAWVRSLDGQPFLLSLEYTQAHTRNIHMYVYFLCGLVCTCIHESDAELICMCFSQTF